MSALQLIDVPELGGLDAVEAPRLLAQAWRDQRSGLLELSHEGDRRQIEIRDGAPAGVLSPDGEDTFARFLEDRGEIRNSDRVAVETLARERGCAQASAVLALKLLGAKALYRAMRAEARQQIAETFDWNAGHYRWLPSSPTDHGASNAQKPHDILYLLQEELPCRWGTDRLFRALVQVQHLRGDIAPGFRKVAEKLARAGAPARRVLARLDGKRSIGQILGECAGDPRAAATLWTAIFSGVVRIGDEAARPGGSAAVELDFEVEVEEGSTPSASIAPAVTAAPEAPVEHPKAIELRDEIESLLVALADIDHYTALGLEEDASSEQTKRAYFRAAKKYHPDALARVGLDDVKEQAAQVFGRLAEAFEVLSDPDKKKAYDARGTDAPEIDTARLAQAETSFRKGEILAKMGNFEAALAYFGPAVELWPDEPAYHAGLGWALHKQPKANSLGAVEHLEIALAAAPDDSVILFRLGLVLRAAGETGRANELMARARATQAPLDV